MKYSLTYIGVIITMVSYLAQLFEINITHTDIETTITTITLFIGGLITLYGRYRKKDVNILGVKK